MTSPTPLGTRVRAFRIDKGWSQERLAREAGLLSGSVERIEQGRCKKPRFDVVEAIAGALGKSLDELAGESGKDRDRGERRAS